MSLRRIISGISIALVAIVFFANFYEAGFLFGMLISVVGFLIGLHVVAPKKIELLPMSGAILLVIAYLACSAVLYALEVHEITDIAQRREALIQPNGAGYFLVAATVSMLFIACGFGIRQKFEESK